MTALFRSKGGIFLAGEEKTEKATPKKRKDAREKEGSVLQSNEIVIAVSVLGSFAALGILANYMFVMMMNALKDWLAELGTDPGGTVEYFQNVALRITVCCVLIIGPILVITAFLSVLPVIVQTKGLFSMKPLRPKFSKLNPLTGIKRLFSMQSVVGIIKGIIELAAIGIVVYIQIQGRITQLAKLTDMTPMQGVLYTADSVYTIVMTVAVIFAFVAAGDYVFQWWQYEKNLKMSKQEIKDEYKQLEGDPQIKGKIKQKQREMAQMRMMEEVPSSDVVIRNPTHFAVALKYNPTKDTSAPVVVAKGMDALALKIVAIAEENNVSVTENRPLARALYETVDVGAAIPPDMYNAVAVVLSEVYTQKGTLEKVIRKTNGIS